MLVSPDYIRQFPSTNNANVSGITSSCFFLGAGAGAIAAFVLGDKLGRRKTIALGLLCNTIGAILQMLSWYLPQMIIGRLVNGFGIGLVSSMSPVYLSECAKSHVRGMLMAVGTCCNVACFCIANCKSLLLDFGPPPLLHYTYRDRPVTKKVNLILILNKNFTSFENC